MTQPAADQPAETPEPAEPAEPAEPTAVRRRRPPGAVLGLAVVVALLAALVGVLGVRAVQADRIKAYYSPSSAPLSAAREASRAIFSYDYRTLDRDFARGRDDTTGAFRADYEMTTTKVVRDVALRYSAVVSAEPVVAGISAASRGRVVAVVFVNQSTTSTRVQGQKLDTNRVRMALREVRGRWLVERVDAL